jgi:integrase
VGGGRDDDLSVGPFFRIAILTLQRREEVAAMRWSEMAPNLSVWNMPGARMKNGKRHDVHLSRPAQAVLRALSEALSKDRGGAKGQICDFVFSTTGETSISGFSRAKARLDAAVAEARDKAAAATGTEPAPPVPWRLHEPAADRRLDARATLYCPPSRNRSMRLLLCNIWM